MKRRHSTSTRRGTIRLVYSCANIFQGGWSSRRSFLLGGVGHLLIVRLNVRPEVTVFHLDRA